LSTFYYDPSERFQVEFTLEETKLEQFPARLELEAMQQAIEARSVYAPYWQERPEWLYAYESLAQEVEELLLKITRSITTAEVQRYREILWQYYQQALASKRKEQDLYYAVANFLYEYQPLSMADEERLRLIEHYFSKVFQEGKTLPKNAHYSVKPYALFCYEHLKDSAKAIRLCRQLLMKDKGVSVLKSWPVLEAAFLLPNNLEAIQEVFKEIMKETLKIHYIEIERLLLEYGKL
jgi:hypothetical protein